MQPLRLLAVVLALGGMQFSCREETPPQPYARSIELQALDVSCTEAWLKVTLTNTTTDSILLTRDGQSVQTLRLTTADSILIDEGLLSNRSYLYKAYRLSGAGFTDSSQAVQVTTMDTTSHNFTWQIDTLGDGDGSVLYDVAIINDTLAYAVGEIYKRDSLGNWDPQPYGLAIWNGRVWTLRKIMVVSQQGDVHSRVFRGVYAFSASDVWLGDGNAFHWDGRSTFATAYWISGYPGNPTPVLGPNQGIHKFWGTSSSNLYGVGVNGGIAHYDGTGWRRLESGTSVSINDIWGAVDPGTGKRTILCAASNVLSSGEKKILSISEQNTVDTVPWISNRRVHSIWFETTQRIYACGDGVLVKRLDDKWKEILGISAHAYFTEGVRGIQSNDIFIVGDFGAVAHWNGHSVQLFPEVSAADIYYTVDYKSNLMVGVGFLGSRAVVLQMRR